MMNILGNIEIFISCVLHFAVSCIPSHLQTYWNSLEPSEDQQAHLRAAQFFILTHVTSKMHYHLRQERNKQQLWLITLLLVVFYHLLQSNNSSRNK